MKKERIKINYKPLWKMMIDKDISKESHTKTGGLSTALSSVWGMMSRDIDAPSISPVP
ncbi:hypothetical protein [uncultured Ligilactobacillus sp.]|uniref:hypothetical protein n=1 Tax=uncultured Ligilactobacillus sp. TaxID=2837633 RepID=UPI00272DAE43|nr:hypothetical protein [uncultured Ligilactobacillus sp.]